MPLPRRPGFQRPSTFLIIGAFLLLQVACRPVRELPPEAPQVPATHEPIPAGYTRFRVIPAESEIRALVYRDGSMARLGHNHVLNSRSLSGDVYMDAQGHDARFTLVLPVASLNVDNPDLRTEEGEEFPGAVAPGAIEGTRRNLLSDALLDAARFPKIRLTSRGVAGAAPDYMVTMAVEVNGRTHELTVPVLVERKPDSLLATGHFTVTHGELGLTPFTVMGGLLSVRDEIRIRFRILARPG